MSHLLQTPATPSNPSNWSRTGCITCKSRRKRCDRTRPSCTNCEKRGIPCEGYDQLFIIQTIGSTRKKGKTRSTPRTLRAPAAAASSSSSASPHTTCSEPLLTDSAPESSRRHHRHRRNTTASVDLTWVNIPYPQGDATQQLVSGADPPVIVGSAPYEDLEAVELGLPLPLCDTAEGLLDLEYALDLEDGHLALDPGAALTQGDETENSTDNKPDDLLGGRDDMAYATTLPPFLSVFPNFSHQDFYYLQYLDEQAAKQLLNVDLGAFNPLRRLILPRALDCPGVLNSICAVAACHQAQRSDPDARIDQFFISISFYLKSVDWLRSSFHPETEPRELESMSMDDTSIITSLLLCKYEIIRGSATHWRDHLNGLEWLVKKKGGISSLETECGQYVASFLRYHRMVSDICHCERSNSEHAENLDMVAASAGSLDAYSGCAHHLLRACHDIAKLVGRLELGGSFTYADFSKQTANIVASLGTCVIEPDIEAYSDAITISQLSRILYVAQRTRYAAFVFLHSTVDRAIEICNFGDTERVELQRQIPYTKSQALDGCLEMLSEIHIGEHCEFAGLALALFLAGCEVEEEHRKYVVLENLFLIERSFGLGHLARAKDALMMIWQQEKRMKHKVWWNIVRELGWELILC